MKKLKIQDVVRTKLGSIAVVEQVNNRGEVTLVLPASALRKGEPVGWYAPEDLEFVITVKEAVERYEHARIAQAGMRY